MPTDPGSSGPRAEASDPDPSAGEAARLGASAAGEGLVEFRVWAPDEPVAVVVGGRSYALEPEGEGFRSATVPAAPGDTYLYEVAGEAWPDPASRSQPEGVRGPSQVIAPYRLERGAPLALEELVLYELHVGTFSEPGTFDGAIPQLAALRDLGVTAIELMPVATGPGNRNWGYDGLYLSAPHPAYGGPDGLARLIEAAHAEGLGVVVDVVYNHLGPGSEAITAFGPYHDPDRSTFWGHALDFGRRGVREWAIQNAELLVRDFGVDGLRLDAVHAIEDTSAVHVLRELRDRVKAIAPGVLVISEMGPEDFRPLEDWGHDAMWLDSLHHELHVLLTGEREGYYEDFGTMEGLVRELSRPQPERLVVCAQNHDQVGNRAVGDRLPPDAHRVALAIVLFSLSTPLLFMGEEYDETRPFQFFTDHIDPEIARGTTEGRKREFEKFTAFGGDVPDPQDVETFRRSKLDRRPSDPLYAELIALRKELPRELEIDVEGSVLRLRRGDTELRADLNRHTVQLHR